MDGIIGQADGRREVRRGAERDTQLDERQRLHLHAASHAALRVVMLAIVGAMIVFNVLYEDLTVSLTLAAIVFLGLFVQWWSLRRTGLAGELDEVAVRDMLRSRPITPRNAMMATILFLAGTSRSIREGSLEATEALLTASLAIVGAYILWHLERWIARRQLRRDRTSVDDISF